MHAVWTGRFQPVHVGHFAILSHSIEFFRIPHVVVLTAYFGWESEGKYGQYSREAYDPARNPFTPWERAMLMRLGLREYGLEGDVTIMIAPRHDFSWDFVAEFYPPERIICLTAKDGFEEEKAELWRRRGERVHVFTEIACDVLTTTKIRRRVAAGENWKRYIPGACHSYFVDIGGPWRAFGVHEPGNRR